MIEYEVKCSQTWAWYQGYVVDFSVQDDKFHVTYPDDWKKDEWVHVSWVRQKYESSHLSVWIPSENEQAECKARGDLNEPYGWWPVTVEQYVEESQDVTGIALYLVSFNGWGDEHSELLDITYLRKKSTSKIFSRGVIQQQFICVPKELKQCLVTHKNNNSILETLIPHHNISSQIIHIKWWEAEDKLIIFGMGSILKIMTGIIHYFFQRLTEKKQFEFTAQDMLRFTNHLTELMTAGYIRDIQNLLPFNKSSYFNIPWDVIKLTLSYINNYYMMMSSSEMDIITQLYESNKQKDAQIELLKQELSAKDEEIKQLKDRLKQIFTLAMT